VVTVSRRRDADWGSVVVFGAAALLALGFLGKAALPYLLLDPAALARYASRRVWLLAHIALVFRHPRSCEHGPLPRRPSPRVGLYATDQRPVAWLNAG